MTRLLALIVVLCLSACMTTHERQVEGWPQLNVVTHVVAPSEIYPICTSQMSVWQKLGGALPLACSGVNFETGECHVVISDPTPKGVLEHELDHCKGWDHGGVYQRAFDHFKATGKNLQNAKGST